MGKRKRKRRRGREAPAAGPSEPAADSSAPEAEVGDSPGAGPEAAPAGEAARVTGPPEAAPTEEAARVTVPPGAAPIEAGSSRRGFFRHLWLALGGFALLEYVWVIINFLQPRPSPEELAGIVIAGPVERFEPDSVTAFQRGKFYLSRLEDGGFLALSRECTHLGCTVPWVEEERRFICPCHASEYDARGVVVNPPAPRPLDLHPIRIENGIIKVDTSVPLKRTAFDSAQVVEA